MVAPERSLTGAAAHPHSATITTTGTNPSVPYFRKDESTINLDSFQQRDAESRRLALKSDVRCGEPAQALLALHQLQQNLMNVPLILG